MKDIIITLLFILMIAGCTQNETDVSRVSIDLTIRGLDFESDGPVTLKSSQENIFSDFEHKYARGEINLSGSGANYSLGIASIVDGFTLSVKEGAYQLFGYGGYAGPAGSPEMAYGFDHRELVIDGSTSTVYLDAFPTCALLLVADQNSKLETAFIKINNNNDAQFFQDGYFHYTYFEPMAPYQAHIIKKDGSEMIIETGNLENGIIYKIEVLGDTTSIKRLEQTFDHSAYISW